MNEIELEEKLGNEVEVDEEMNMKEVGKRR